MHKFTLNKKWLASSLPISGFTCNPGERPAFHEEQSSGYMDYIILCFHLVSNLDKVGLKVPAPKGFEDKKQLHCSWANMNRLEQLLQSSHGPAFSVVPSVKSTKTLQTGDGVSARLQLSLPLPHSWHIMRKCVHPPLYSTN